jgi:hypothetical protein
MVNLDQTVALLEKALQSIGPERMATHDVRMHISRALNEARHALKKENRRAAKQDDTTPLERWQLDIATQSLISPQQQKLAVSAIDKLINAEQKKLDDLESRAHGKDTPLDTTDVGTILG